MRRILYALAFFAFLFVAPRVAHATTCTVPNTFSNGTTADATQVNANFTALQNCGNNIDHNNVGSGGIYASQIIPTSVGQALFGGGVTYQFQNGLIIATQDGSGNGLWMKQGVLNLAGNGNYAASSCLHVNASGDMLTLGGDCAVLNAANTYTATQTVPNLIDSGLAASSPVCTNASSQLVTGCTTQTVLDAAGSSQYKVTWQVVTVSWTGACSQDSACYSAASTIVGGNSFTSTATYSCQADPQSSVTNGVQFHAYPFSTTQFQLVAMSLAQSFASGQNWNVAVSCMGK